jgi:uncharacterized membrane protein
LKNKRTIVTAIIVAVILGLAFYLSKMFDHSMALFVITWIVAIVLIRVILTPLVVWLVRARDAKKEATQPTDRSPQANDHDSNTLN